MPRTNDRAPQKHLLRSIAGDLDTQDDVGFLFLCADGHEVGFPAAYLDEVIRALRKAARDVEAQRQRRARG